MEASALQAPTVGIARITLAPRLLRLRSDEQLVALFRAGSDDAFGVIHDRYRQRLFAYCRQMLSSRQDAEDALQDVFIRAYSALRAGDRPIALRAWLYRVAHNRCVDHLRRPLPPAAEILELSKGPMPDPLAEAERRDDLKRLVADLRRLPNQQRSVLLMRELEGLSYADLAETLDVTVPAVKSLLVRARMGLVEAAEARDTACSDIREDLALAQGRGVRANARARRHLRDCAGCRAYRQDMRRVQRSLAALTPAGPLALLAKLTGLGGPSGGGGGAVGGGAAGSSAGAGGLAGGGAAAGSGITAATGGGAAGGAAAGAGGGVATASGVAASAGSGVAAGGGAAGGGLASAGGVVAGGGVAAGGGAAAGGGLIAAGGGAAALTAGKVAAVVSAVVVAGSGAAAVEQNLAGQTSTASPEPATVQVAPAPVRPDPPAPLVKPKSDSPAVDASAPTDATTRSTAVSPTSGSTSDPGAGDAPSAANGGLAAPSDTAADGGPSPAQDKSPAPRSQSSPVSSSAPSLATPRTSDAAAGSSSSGSGGSGAQP